MEGGMFVVFGNKCMRERERGRGGSTVYQASQ